jgi:nitrite reductase (NO-forming)
MTPRVLSKVMEAVENFMAPGRVMLTERAAVTTAKDSSGRPRNRRVTAVAVVAFALLTLSLSRQSAAQSQFTFTAERKQISIGSGLSYPAWTYNGSVPGPLMRVQQGDDVKITLINHTTDAHGIYTHAAQLNDESFAAPLGVNQLSYRFSAQVPGVFDYHCTAEPVLDHIAEGMYGMMIVDPKNGWPNGKANEVMLVQGEFYGKPDAHGFVRPDHSKMIEGQPDFVVFNGRMSHYDVGHPIPIKIGELVRIFFINIGPNLFSDFHVVGALFSTVYRSGNPADALHDLQSFEVGPGDGAVFEFKVYHPGTYMFMDHSMGHAYKGAMGIFRAAP